VNGRVISHLPAGELHVAWYDRRQREGTVVLVAHRLPAALNDKFFAKQIPRWQRHGVALDLHVYEADE
jgi:hypothetical protein